jgi:hypothetical protein
MLGYFPSFARLCRCTQNRFLLDFIARWLGSRPETYGYYAADDSTLSSRDAGAVAAYVARIKRADPRHTVMISSGNEAQASQYQAIPDVIGQEIYPVTTFSLLPAILSLDWWYSVAQTVSDSQRAADRAHKQSAFILQAFTWGDNIADGAAVGACSAREGSLSCYHRLRYPSASEQLQLRNLVLRGAHPKLILWWSFPQTYGSATNDTYSIYPAGSVAASRWRGLSSVIRSRLGLLGTLARLLGR